MEGKKFRFRDLGGLLKKSYNDWNDDDAFTLAASVAFYAIFSLPALLLIIVTIAGIVFGQQAVEGQISSKISSALGQDAANQIESMISSASVSGNSTIMIIIGITTLIVSATGVMVQLQKALNKAWEVKADPHAGVGKMAIDRIESFFVILLIGLLLVIFMLATTLLSALSSWISRQLPQYTIYLFYAFNFLVSFGFITVFFAIILKVLPDVKIRFRSVWTGATITAFLFMIGKFAMGYYFGNFSPASAFGAAGTIILLLLFIYYSALIFFFGAEFTQVYARNYGHQIEPSKYAVKDDPCSKQVHA